MRLLLWHCIHAPRVYLLKMKFNYKGPRSLGAQLYRSAIQESVRSTGLDVKKTANVRCLKNEEQGPWKGPWGTPPRSTWLHIVLESLEISRYVCSLRSRTHWRKSVIQKTLNNARGQQIVDQALVAIIFVDWLMDGAIINLLNLEEAFLWF